MPNRIQLRRTKGWRLPDNTVNVARPTKWGNPFKVGEPIPRDSELWPYLDFLYGESLRGFKAVTLLQAADAVNCYERWLADRPWLFLAVFDELPGKDLACWCPLDAACHADALLDLANS